MNKQSYYASSVIYMFYNVVKITRNGVIEFARVFQNVESLSQYLKNVLMSSDVENDRISLRLVFL